MIYKTTLPFPPSVNKIKGVYRGKQIKSKEYRAWEKNCPNLVLPECGAIDWPVHVIYRFYMPDQRLRDIGNFEKATTDQLVKQCILMDDNTKIIQSLHLNFAGIDRGNPRVEIEIYEMKDNVECLQGFF